MHLAVQRGGPSRATGQVGMVLPASCLEAVQGAAQGAAQGCGARRSTAMVLGGEDGAGSLGGRGGQSWRWRGGRRHTVRPCSAADPAGPGSSLQSAAARGSDHSCLGRRAGVEVSCSALGFARCRPPSHYLGRFPCTCDLLAAPRRRRLAQRQAGLSPFPLSAVRLSSTCGLQGHSLIRKHGCFVLYLRLLLLFLRAGASLRQCLVLPSVRRGALEPPACRASSGLRDIAPSSSLPPPWPGASSRDTPLAAASQPGPVPQVPDLCHPPQPRPLPLRVP